MVAFNVKEQKLYDICGQVDSQKNILLGFLFLCQWRSVKTKMQIKLLSKNEVRDWGDLYLYVESVSQYLDDKKKRSEITYSIKIQTRAWPHPGSNPNPFA